MVQEALVHLWPQLDYRAVCSPWGASSNWQWKKKSFFILKVVSIEFFPNLSLIAFQYYFRLHCPIWNCKITLGCPWSLSFDVLCHPHLFLYFPHLPLSHDFLPFPWFPHPFFFLVTVLNGQNSPPGFPLGHKRESERDFPFFNVSLM